MVVDIVIPVRGQLHLTQSILAQLESMEGWNHCWILDNGKGEDDTWDWLKDWSLSHKKFTPLPAKGMTIYEMWDKGFHCSRFADHVLFLNNDVELHPSTIVALSNALEAYPTNGIAYPDYNSPVQFGNMCNLRVTSGTYRHGGMSGFCFMLKRIVVDWSPLVDPQFIWWGGDDDIAFNVEARHYRQVRVIGLPIVHLHEGTAQHHDLGAQKGKDLQAVIDKWGR